MPYVWAPVGIRVIYILAIRQAHRAGWCRTDLARETGLAYSAVGKIVKTLDYPSTKGMPRNEAKLAAWYSVFQTVKDGGYDEYMFQKALRGGAANAVAHRSTEGETDAE